MADQEGVTEGEAAPKKRPGRPRKSEMRVHSDEIEKLLVYGEQRPHPETGQPTQYFPSFRELAERFKVSHTTIGALAERRNCVQRRAELERQTRDKVAAEVVERRKDSLVVTVETTVQVIDSYIVQFLAALEDGRVRVDNPADLNTLVRLKQYLLGGADSRQEVHEAISLEVLQQRHRVTTQALAEATVEEKGVVERKERG